MALVVAEGLGAAPPSASLPSASLPSASLPSASLPSALSQLAASPSAPSLSASSPSRWHGEARGVAEARAGPWAALAGWLDRACAVQAGRVVGGSGVPERLEGFAGLLSRVRSMVLAGHCSLVEDLVGAVGTMPTVRPAPPPPPAPPRNPHRQGWEGVVSFSRAGVVDWTKTAETVAEDPSWSLASSAASAYPLVPAVMGALRAASVGAGRRLGEAPAREAAGQASDCLAAVLTRDPVALPDAAELVTLACALLGDPLVAAPALRLLGILAVDHSRVEQCFPEEAVAAIVSAAALAAEPETQDAAALEAALGALAALAVGGQATGLLVRLKAHEVAQRVAPATANSLALLLGLCAHLAAAVIPTAALLDEAAILCEGATSYAAGALGSAPPELRDDALLVILAGGVVGGPVLARALEVVFVLGQETDCRPLVMLAATHLVAGCRPSGGPARDIFAKLVVATPGFGGFARAVIGLVSDPAVVARRCALGLVAHLSSLCPRAMWELKVVPPLCAALASCALPPASPPAAPAPSHPVAAVGLSDSRSAVLAAKTLARVAPEATGAELTAMLDTCVLALGAAPSPPRAVTAVMHLLAELLPRAPRGAAVSSNVAWVAEVASRVLLDGLRGPFTAPDSPLQAAATSVIGGAAFLWGGGPEDGSERGDEGVARPHGALRRALASALVSSIATAQAQQRPVVRVPALAAQTTALTAVVRGLPSAELTSHLARSELLLTVSAQLQHGATHAQPALALLVAFQRHHGNPDVIQQIARLNLYDWASQALITSPSTSAICKLSLALLGHALDVSGTPVGIIPAGLRGQLFHRSVELITAGGRKSSRRSEMQGSEDWDRDDGEGGAAGEGGPVTEEGDEGRPSARKEDDIGKGGQQGGGLEEEEGEKGEPPPPTAPARKHLAPPGKPPKRARSASRLVPQQWAPAMRVAEALLPDRGSLGDLVPGLVGALSLRKSEEEVRWSMNLLWRLVDRDEDAVRLDMDRAGVPAVLLDPSQEDRAKALGALERLCCAGSALPGARRIRSWVFGADRPAGLLALVVDPTCAAEVRAAAARLLVAVLEDEPEHVRGSYDHDIVAHLSEVLGGPALPPELALPVLRIASLALADSDNAVEACVGPLARRILAVLDDLQVRLGEEALRAGLSVVSMIAAAGGPSGTQALAVRSFCRDRMLQAGAIEILCALLARGGGGGGGGGSGGGGVQPSDTLALAVLEIVLRLVSQGLARAAGPRSLALAGLFSPAAVAGLTHAITAELAGAALSPADLVLSLPLLDSSCELLLQAFLKAGGAESLGRVVTGCPLDQPEWISMYARMLAAVRLLVGLAQANLIARTWLSTHGSVLSKMISLIDKISTAQQESEAESGAGRLPAPPQAVALAHLQQHRATQPTQPLDLVLPSQFPAAFSLSLSSRSRPRAQSWLGEGRVSPTTSSSSGKEREQREQQRVPITEALSQSFNLPSSHTYEALADQGVAEGGYSSSLPRGAAVSFLRGVPSSGSVGRLSTGRASAASVGREDSQATRAPMARAPPSSSADLTPADDMFAALTLCGLFLLGGAPMPTQARADLLSASVLASEAFPFMSVCRVVLGIITGICNAHDSNAELPCPRGLARFFHICLRARDELPAATLAAIASNIAGLPRMCVSEADAAPLCDLAGEFCLIFSASEGPELDARYDSLEVRSACLEALMALADSPVTRRHVTALGLRELISRSLKAMGRADRESEAAKAYQALGLEALQVISQRKLKIGATASHPDEAILLSATDPLSVSLDDDDLHQQLPPHQVESSDDPAALTASGAPGAAAVPAKTLALAPEVKRARGLTVAHYSRNKSRAITIKQRTDFSAFFSID